VDIKKTKPKQNKKNKQTTTTKKKQLKLDKQHTKKSNLA